MSRTQNEVDWAEITKKEFRAYQWVRASGITNMYDVPVVEDLSGLDRDTIFAIMRHYGDLTIKYPYDCKNCDYHVYCCELADTLK